MKCPYCGAETISRQCEYCDSDLSEYINNRTIGGAFSSAVNNTQPDFVNVTQNIITGQIPQPRLQTNASPKNKTVAIILCIIGLFGAGGLHRLYTGHILSGILWLCTGGLGYVGTVIDLVLLLTDNFKDKNQLKLLPEENL